MFMLEKNSCYRRRMTYAAVGVTRAMGAYAPRKRLFFYIIVMLLVGFTIFILSSSTTRLTREDEMEQRVIEMQNRLEFLESLYRTRHENVLSIQNKVSKVEEDVEKLPEPNPAALKPEVLALLRNITGTKAAAGIHVNNYESFKTPFVLQLLPYLMNDPDSLVPAYHMKGERSYVDVVLGIPTVKRDKESYLMITLTHLINGLTKDDVNATLIVVMVGDTDLEYVINIARQIETMFPKHVENGLIEVLSPSASYYPDFDSLPTTLGDSLKRVQWRTKQNLDTIYLMAYAKSKGVYYLMLEDDIIAKNNYMQDIRRFNSEITISTPDWFFIEYCTIGGIGKLFRSSDLIHFITYVQLFYNNMPIDWLLESYLADRVCSIDKSSQGCGKEKLRIRPKYKTSLFQHIGLYSSLKGKIQKIKDSHFGPMPTFYPHTNPPVESLHTDIHEHADHTLKKAYEGQTYFWGKTPKKGDTVEFKFEKPTHVERYTFRSGNAEHVSDKFSDTVVEALPANSENYTAIGNFDEFGLADGEVSKEMGPLSAIRLRVNSDSLYWVILSEIDLKVSEQGSS